MADQERHVADHGWLPQEVARENAAGLAKVRATIDAGPYVDTWDSLAAYEVPRWFQDAKFGIFIHWGVYSVPAFGSEWYPRNMYRQGTPEFEHHVATYGPHASSATRTSSRGSPWTGFDARTMGGVVPARRARSSSSRWPSTTTASRCTTAAAPGGRRRAMGPQRDVLGELVAEAGPRRAGRRSLLAPRRALVLLQRRRRGSTPTCSTRAFAGPLRAGRSARRRSAERGVPGGLAAAHRGDHRPVPAAGRCGSTGGSSSPPSSRTCASSPPTTTTARPSGARGRHPVQAARRFAPGHGGVRHRARATLAGSASSLWQNDTSVSRNSWGWIDGPGLQVGAGTSSTSSSTSSRRTACCCSTSGPKPDGTIARGRGELLAGVGDWLDVNGEAIYGTRPWVVPGEGPTDGRRGFLHRPVAAALHAPRPPVHPTRLP